MKTNVSRLDPLDYLIGVINDPGAQPTRRDRLALAALPYCHAKVGDKRVTKKDQQAKALKKTLSGDTGNGWGRDLMVTKASDRHVEG